MLTPVSHLLTALSERCRVSASYCRWVRPFSRRSCETKAPKTARLICSSVLPSFLQPVCHKRPVWQANSGRVRGNRRERQSCVARYGKTGIAEVGSA